MPFEVEGQKFIALPEDDARELVLYLEAVKLWGDLIKSCPGVEVERPKPNGQPNKKSPTARPEGDPYAVLA